MVQYLVKAVGQGDLTDTLMKSADPDSFPNIIILLVLRCTLPATSAEAELSFSVLRLIKSHFRSWMADIRFSALTLIKMHYCKHIDSKIIADRFIKEHHRRFFKVILFD